MAILLALVVAGAAIWLYLRTPAPPENNPPTPIPRAATPTQVAVAPSPVPTLSPGPKICLIIDDGGYQRGEALKALYTIRVPITVSIIPDVEFSTVLAEEFPEHGIEVMCHMPMEGHEKGMVGNAYKALLRKGMDPSLARQQVIDALKGLPHCRGLNNHMGSVATEDLTLMKAVCSVLRDQGLYVIDSRTTAKSQVARAARQEGVPCASRNVFLDNQETPGAIQAQLVQAAAYARKHGLVVAIGHFKVTTLRTLSEVIPGLEEQGFQFVHPSQVVK
ncbi:MAG TPA: divergent polysaccharide deacetylase family protein [bacterium]|nr:divergent polysaccharide deacetylase family protein [bacterium]